MGAGRSALQTDELKLLNRLHRRLWVAALSFHGAKAVGSAWLILPLGPEASWPLLLVCLVLKVGLWVLLVATAVRLARVARPWWGLWPRSSAMAVALGALLPIALALAAGFRMRSLARRLSLPGSFFGLREEGLMEEGGGGASPPPPS